MTNALDPDNLSEWFPRDDRGGNGNGNGSNGNQYSSQQYGEVVDQQQTRRLGVVVGGSLTKGLDVKLDRETEIEDLAVGRYVVVRGKHKRFFCMVTDVVLDSTNPAIRSDPPDLSDP